MTKKVKKQSNTPFDDVFRTLLEKCNKLIIPVINEIFHTNYSLDEEVVALANEHFVVDEDNKEVKRITDSYLKIRDNLYHLECQSTGDFYMEIRMIEYDFHIALSELKNSTEEVNTLEFPQSAILVIRDIDSFEEILNINLKVPKYTEDGTIYNSVPYSVPIVKITDYTKEDIFNKNLLFFIPYYIMKFEKRLDKINNSPSELAVLRADYEDIYNKLLVLATQDKFNRRYFHDLISLIIKLVNIVAKDKDNIKREVDMLGGNVLELESEIIMAEAERKGLEKGMQQGENMLSKLVAILLESELYDEIKKVTADKDYREELYKKYNIK